MIQVVLLGLTKGRQENKNVFVSIVLGQQHQKQQNQQQQQMQQQQQQQPVALQIGTLYLF